MKLKLLFVISDMMGGGAERSMSNITTHLPDNVEADLLLNSVSEVDFPTDARIISLGMKPTIQKNLLYQLRANIKRIRALRKLKKKNQYDACISFIDSANICNILTKTSGCKTIVSVRNFLPDDKKFVYQYIVIPLIKKLYNRADWVVGVSEEISQSLVAEMKISESYIKTITNGYDISTIMHQCTKVVKDLQEYKDKFVYINIGRYTYQKAQWHLIRAFMRVHSKCSDTVLIIMGQGEERQYLEELTSECDLKDSVVFIPYQTNPWAYLYHNNVFVIPSMYEGYCNTLCEALICGVPCIATDFRSSAREILAPDTNMQQHIDRGIEYAKYGILTPVCSGEKNRKLVPLEEAERDLAEAMMVLYNDKKLYQRYKELAQERGMQMGIDDKVEQWLEIAGK